VAAPAARQAAAAAQATPAEAGLDVDIDVEDTDQAPAEEELDFDLEAIPDEAEAHPQRFDESELGTSGGEIGGHFIDEEPAPAAAETGFDLSEQPAPERGAPETSTAPFPAVSMTAAPAAPAQLVVPSAAPARVSGVPAELRRGLDEIESYVAAGFVQDAQRVLAELARRFAGHPALAQRLSELGLELPGSAAAGEEFVLVEPPAVAPLAAPLGADEPLQLGADFLDLGAAPPAPAAGALDGLAPAPIEPSEAEPAQEPGGFDLSAELGDLFGAHAAVAEDEAAPSGTDLGDAALADIFREFQKGVDKQLGKEDYETRYNLGIAYKEMGLVDEAIAEFQLAAKDDARLLECASMLGICFLEKGMPKLAVKWFEKGLQAPGRSEDEYQALRYDLANALEQGGEGERALAIFSELFGQNAKFRDVAEKVRRLGAR
jgi:tetratricopeptide (TPR) repeat protein